MKTLRKYLSIVLFILLLANNFAFVNYVDAIKPPAPTSDIQVTKTAGSPVETGTGVYTVNYSIVVNNVGTASGTYTLTDAVTLVTGVTSSVGTVSHTDDDANASPAVNSGFNGTGDTTIITSEDVNAGGTDTFTYTVTYTVLDSTKSSKQCNGSKGTDIIAIENNASVSGSSDSACVNLGIPAAEKKITFCHVPPGNEDGANELTTSVSAYNNPSTGHVNHELDYVGSCLASSISVQKTAGTPVKTGTGIYTVAYTLSVSNTGGTGFYTLTDTVTLPAGVTSSVGTVSHTDDDANTSPAVNSGFNGTGDTTIITNEGVLGGGTDTFTYTVTYTVPLDNTASTNLCSGAPNTGNIVSVPNSVVATNGSSGGTGGSDNACVELDVPVSGPTPTPILGITKTAGSPVTTGTGVYTVAYSIVVSNTGSGAGTYTLTDAVTLPTGVTSSVGAVSHTDDDGNTTPAVNGSFNGVGDTTIITGENVDAAGTDTFTYTVTYTVATSTSPSSTNCSGGSNTLDIVAVPNIASISGDTDNACVDLAIPAVPPVLTPILGITKSSGTPVQTATGVYTVAYSVVVNNTGSGAGTYTLTDAVTLTTGVTSSVGTVSHTDDDGNAVPAVNSGFNGIGDTNIITGENVDAGGTDTFTYTVTYTVLNTTVASANLCSGTANTGDIIAVGNSASIGGTSDTSCVDLTIPASPPAPAPNVGITKTAGAPVTTGTGVYTVDYSLVVNNVGTATGTYTLTDVVTLVTGVTSSVGTVTHTDDDGNVVPAVNGSFNGVGDTTIITAEDVGAGATDTFTYTVTYTVADANTTTTSTTKCDTSVNPGDIVAVGNTASIGTKSDNVCVDLTIPAAPVLTPILGITKTAGAPVTTGTGVYTVEYTVVVNNTGSGAGIYTLTDFVTLVSGVTTSVGSVIQTDDDTDLSPLVNSGFNGTSDTNIITGENVGAGGTDTFVYTVTYTVQDTTASSTTKCDATTNPGNIIAVGNSASIGGTADTSCVDLVIPATPPTPTPNLQITKSSTSPATTATGVYTVDYSVVVSNVGTATGTYTLTDLITLVSGVTTSVGSVSHTDDDGNTVPAVNGSFNGLGDQTIITAESVGAGATDTFTYTVTYTVADDNTTAASATKCDTTTNPGNIVAIGNTVTLDTNASSNSCVDLVIPVASGGGGGGGGTTPTSNVGILKSSGTPVETGTGIYTVDYSIVVSNTGTATGTYTLTDLVTLVSGVTTSVGTVTQTDDDTDVSPVVNPGFNGVGDQTIITGESISVGGTDTFVYTVTFTILDTTLASSAKCDTTTNPGNIVAIGNIASISGNSDNSCVDLTIPAKATIPVVPSGGTGGGGSSASSCSDLDLVTDLWSEEVGSVSVTCFGNRYTKTFKINCGDGSADKIISAEGGFSPYAVATCEYADTTQEYTVTCNTTKDNIDVIVASHWSSTSLSCKQDVEPINALTTFTVDDVIEAAGEGGGSDVPEESDDNGGIGGGSDTNPDSGSDDDTGTPDAPQLEDIQDEEVIVGPTEIKKYPTILPQTGTPISERVATLDNPKVYIDLPEMTPNYDTDINNWKLQLPEQDRDREEYVIIPSNGLVVPMSYVPENSRDYSALIHGREVNINKYLQSGAMVYPGTSLNNYGEDGNRVVFGHSSYWNSDEGRYKTQFQKIIELDEGEEIWVYKVQEDGTFKRFVYMVDKSYETLPTDIDVLKQREGSNLTLVTCTPIGGIENRWIVKAKFIEEDTIVLKKEEEQKVPEERISDETLLRHRNFIYEFITKLFGLSDIV